MLLAYIKWLSAISTNVVQTYRCITDTKFNRSSPKFEQLIPDFVK